MRSWTAGSWLERGAVGTEPRWGLGVYATIVSCMVRTHLSIDFPSWPRSETECIGNLERSCVHQVYDAIRFTKNSRPHACMLCVCFVHFAHARARMCVRACLRAFCAPYDTGLLT